MNNFGKRIGIFCSSSKYSIRIAYRTTEVFAEQKSRLSGKVLFKPYQKPN
jgi:hypothetical protein